MNTESFDQIKDTWFTVRDNFQDAYAACQTQGQRDAVVAARDAARDAYYDALGKFFDESDPYVQQLTTELANENTTIKQELSSLQDVVNIIKVVGLAIKTATALAALAV